MAWHVPISTSQVGTVVALLNNDDAYIHPDVIIFSQNNNTIYAEQTTGGHAIEIEGDVLSGAAAGVFFFSQATAVTGNSLTIASTGLVRSFAAHAVVLHGADTDLFNAGTIQAQKVANFYGVIMYGDSAITQSTIVNSGKIAGGWAIGRLSASTETIDLKNSGLIDGLTASYSSITQGDTIARDLITNTGRMIGQIELGGGDDRYSGAAGRLTGKLFAGGGNDTVIGGIDHDWQEGGDGEDALSGNAGNDTLKGDIGEDKLNGGLGKDTLTGGQDADLFVFSAKTHSVVGANADRIMDFDDGNAGDRIDLSALFGAAMTYRANAAFTAAGQVRINDVAGADIVVEVNTGGTLAADFSIRLVATTLASMNAGDFIL